MSVTLVDAIRAFCQADTTIKAAVGGNRDPVTPYVRWNPETYNYPYATMFQIGGNGAGGGKLEYVFGGRGSPYLEPVDIQFTFWDSNENTSTETAEARISRNVDYFSQMLNDQVLTLTNSVNIAVTMIRSAGMPQFVGTDKPNNVNAASWMSAVVFRFIQHRTVGVVE